MKKIKVWFVEIGEPLPVQTEQRLHRYGNLTKKLANLGFEVTWLTTTFSHTTKTYVIDEGEHVIDDVKLRVFLGHGYKKNICFDRIKHNYKFARDFSYYCKTAEVPDIIVAPIPIIEVATNVILYAKGKNIPVIVDIRDSWPDVINSIFPKIIQPISKLMLYRAYRKMEYVCSNAYALIGTGDSQIKYGLSFAKREKQKKDMILHIGYPKPPEINSDEVKDFYNKFLKGNGFQENVLTICFLGRIGPFFNFETIINALHKLGSKIKVQFLVGGEGSHLEKYKKLSNDKKVKNIHFLGWLNESQIQAAMSFSNVGISPYHSDNENFSLPNKVFEYLSAGLASLTSLQAEFKTIIKQHNCGLHYKSDNVNELYEAIISFHNDLEETKNMGKRGKKLYESYYTADIIAKKFANHLESVVSECQIH